MKRTAYTLLTLVFLVPLSGAAQDSLKAALTRQGMDYAYNLQSDRASEIFAQLIAGWPDDPHGYVLQAVNYFYRIQIEVDGARYEQPFRNYADAAIKRARDRLGNGPDGEDALFYLGTTYMYRAAYHGTKNDWLKAYWFGKQGIEYLEKLVTLNPEYYDAYLGLGLYHYYADVTPRFVKTVGRFLGLKGDRERGLTELHMAAERGTYARIEAQFFLGNIYLYTEQDPNRALAYAEKLVARYPRGFMVFHGEALQRVGKLDAAEATFQRMLAEYDSLRLPFFTIWARYNLAEVFFQRNQFDRAVQQYHLALQHIARYPERFKWLRAWSTYRLGESYEVMGNRLRAEGFYRKVKKSDQHRAYELAQDRLKWPYSPADRELIRARNLMTARRLQESLDAFRGLLAKAWRNLPGYPEHKVSVIRHYVGRVLLEMGERQKAIAEFQNVLAAKEVSEDWIKPWTYYYLGRTYFELDQPANAEKALSQAAEFDDGRLRFEVEKLQKRIRARLAQRGSGNGPP